MADFGKEGGGSVWVRVSLNIHQILDPTDWKIFHNIKILNQGSDKTME